MKVYVTEMLRWGDREMHSYVIGVYSTKEAAELAGDVEITWRAQKYEFCVSEFDLDDPIAPSKIVYHYKHIDPYKIKFNPDMPFSPNKCMICGKDHGGLQCPHTIAYSTGE
jgi:hypothetical protein